MPINAYVGLMGSGKSFECVRSVIVPAVLAGRSVVTNVDGINGDLIRDFCVKELKGDPDKLGQVRHCKNDDVEKPDFFPHGTDALTFCKPGEMVCIDEAWRFWGVGKKILEQHAIFFREHRHYVDEKTKVSCDLVLMVQDIGDLHRMLKSVVEVTFKTTKLKAVGLNKAYRVEMWEGHKLTRYARLGVENKKYDKKIFPLYSSYSGGSGLELQVDSRQNVLANPFKLFMGFAFLVLGCGCVYYLYWYFTQSAKTHDPDKAAAEKQVTKSDKKYVHPDSAINEYSDKWRYVGRFTNKDGLTMAVISDSSGRVRIESPSVFTGSGYVSVGEVDGKRVTVWTGELTKDQEQKK